MFEKRLDARPRKSRKSPVESCKTVQPCGRLPTAGSLDATAPEPTKLSARQRDLQKKTQRLTGVRMRYRWTVVQRNRKGRAWEIPRPGAQTSTPTAIHAHCLYFIFCRFSVWKRRCYARLALPVPLLLSTISIHLAAYHASGSPIQHTGSPSPNTRQNGICNRKFAQHHLGVRMGYR